MSTGGLIPLLYITEETTCDELPRFEEAYGLATGLIKPIDTLKKVVAYSVPRRKGKTLMLENIAVEAAMDGINTVMVFVTEKLLKDSRDNINARLTQLPEYPERPGVARYGKIVYCANTIDLSGYLPSDAEHILLLDEYPYLSEEPLCYHMYYNGNLNGSLKGTVIAMGTATENP